jgi:hypothetical protein
MCKEEKKIIRCPPISLRSKEIVTMGVAIEAALGAVTVAASGVAMEAASGVAMMRLWEWSR